MTGWRSILLAAGEISTTAGGQVILDHDETESGDHAKDIVESVELDDNVDVLVVSRLHAQQRVNAPTAVEPDGQACLLQHAEDLQYLRCHHTIGLARADLTSDAQRSTLHFRGLSWRWISRWWAQHKSLRLSRLVGPPRDQYQTWCA